MGREMHENDRTVTDMGKQYFVLFQSSAGSLAVEKYFWDYINDNLAGCLVPDYMFDEVETMLAKAQEEYFKTHRGQRVMISIYENFTGSYSLSAGQVSATLLPVKKVIE